jgi:uncharacterized protein YodC (DUF2158 family)
MSSSDINPGDCVRLRSGGPRMTVTKRLPSGLLEVQWFKGDYHNRADYHPDALVPADTGTATGSEAVDALREKYSTRREKE